MHRNFLLSVLFFFSLSMTLHGQCPPGDVVISSQEEMDQFAIDFPNCTQIDGSLTVRSNVEDLYGLFKIEQIEEDLILENCPILPRLLGLNKINFIGRNLSITECNELEIRVNAS